MQLPALARISFKDVQKYLAKQGKKPLPSGVSCGKFVIIKRVLNFQIGLFRYDSSEACGYVKSDEHSKLLKPISQHRPSLDFLPPIDQVATRLQVAAMFVYGADSPYTAPRPDQILFVLKPLTASGRRHENQRVVEATRLLRAKFGHLYDIEVSCNDTLQYSPFRGGGDIYIYCEASGAVVMNNSIPVADLEGGEVWEDGEVRCGAIETKLTSQENSENLILQLHMMILSAKILTKTQVFAKL